MRIQKYRFLVLVLLSSLLLCTKAHTKQPFAEKGVLDLRNWDFQKDGTVKLNGEWAFYWKQFIAREGKADSSSYLEVPALWNNKEIDGQKLSSKGYASYRLLILTESKEQLTLKFFNAATSCWLYVNGKAMLHSGIPEKSKESTTPSYRPGLITFKADADTVELVLEIANFHHKKGGTWEPLLLGEASMVQLQDSRRKFVNLLFIGSAFIMFLFHLMLFIKHPNEKALLYFGFLTLLIAIRYVNTGEFSVYMLGNPNWNFLVRIDYFCFYLAILFFLLFFQSIFKKRLRRSFVQFYAAVSLFFTATVFLLPVRIMTFGMLPFQIITIFGGLHVIWIAITEFNARRRGSDYFLVGFSVLFITTLNDILLENMVVYTIPMASAGIAVFILFKAAMLSSDIREALVENEKLNQSLQLQNQEYYQLTQKYKKQNKTLKKAKQKAEESDHFKSAFLANVSHEIRTPMNGIIGFASLLKRKTLSKEKREEYIDILNERGKYLLGIVNNIIDVSKIEKGQIKLYYEEININALLIGVINNYKPLAKNKNILLLHCLSLPDKQALFTSDRQKLTQILDNLLSNAIKFTREGHIEIGYYHRGNYMEFYVSDTGIGIENTEQKIIFDRFIQANPEIAQKYGGAGLGLSIVKAFVEKLGGKLSVITTPDKGSKFIFTLPDKKTIENK